MNILVGIILFVIGFTMVWKTEAYFSFFGRVAFAEKYLGTEGGSRMFYKLVGLLAIVISFLMITGLWNNIMGNVGEALT